MNKRFITKNIKVSFVNEDEVKGLSVAKKAHKESGKINKSGIEDGYTKLKDLYDYDTTKDEVGLENPPKYTREEFDDEYEIAAKGPGQLALKYDNEGTETFKQMWDRMDALHDKNKEYEKEFGTKAGDNFAAGEPNDVYKELTGFADKYREHRAEYQPTPPVRAEEVNESKAMKRLNFKQSFKDDNHMLSLIKEDYKTDNHTFLMTDGNETYKVRWEGDAENGEGVILQYKNQQSVNEDTEKMKKLFDYKQSSVVGKTNDYINEAVQFKKMMDVLKG
jgi:hypothetical protein